MTQERHCISAGQLFSILFINRSVIMLTYNTLLGGGENMMDNILSALLALGLSFVMVLPIYLLHHRNPQENVLESGGRLLGKPGVVILAIFYGLYFVAIDSYYLSFFQMFLNNVMEPLMPVWLVALAFIAVVCYAAYQGIEGVARTAGFALAIILIGVVWIGVALLPKIQAINFDPFLYDGPKQVFTGTALFLARSTGFTTLALLLPRARGKKKLKFCLWDMGIYALMIFLLLGMVGAGGSYLKNQLFPVYTAASLADAGVLERLDVVFITIWVAGLFVQMSTDAYLFMACLCKATNKIVSRAVLPVVSLVIAALSVTVTHSMPLQKVFYGVPLLFTLTITASVGIPLLLLVVDLIRKKRRDSQESDKGEGRA